MAHTSTYTHTILHAQYKFIVDGEWKYDPNQPAMFDEMGNVNNVLEVHEYVPENLDGLSGFDPPPSPPSRKEAVPELEAFYFLVHQSQVVQCSEAPGFAAGPTCRHKHVGCLPEPGVLAR
eukprot:scaffold151714_cov18-Tisochrysis_lutea.AAC.1